MSAFSTTRANEAFETTFTRPVKAMLQREIAAELVAIACGNTTAAAPAAAARW